MPSKFRLRKPFKPVVLALSKFLIKLGVTPNIATVLMLLSACSSLIALVVGKNLWLFGLLVFITGLFDGADGAIARQTNQKTQFGGFFDSTMDRISEVVIYISFLFTYNRFLIFNINWTAIVVWILVVSSYMISYTRAKLEAIAIDKDKKYDGDIGLFARSERLFTIFCISVIGHFLGAGFFSWALIVFSIGTSSTFAYRVYRF